MNKEDKDTRFDEFFKEFIKEGNSITTELLKVLQGRSGVSAVEALTFVTGCVIRDFFTKKNQEVLLKRAQANIQAAFKSDISIGAKNVKLQ